MPARTEQAIIDAFNRLIAKYPFEKITVDAIGEPKLKYMNSILSKWNSEKLDTLEAIDAYQAEHGKEQGKKAPGQRATQKPGTRPGGSFDTEDFFGDAVRRSFGEDFDPEGK